jgi:NAD(P)H-flavin reductase
MSIVSHLFAEPSRLPPCIRFLYATRAMSSNPREILFLSRLQALFTRDPVHTKTLDFYVTGEKLDGISKGDGRRWRDIVDFKDRRIQHDDLRAALGPIGRRGKTLAYVCGPPPMTEEFVDVLVGAEGMSAERILLEKWW